MRGGALPAEAISNGVRRAGAVISSGASTRVVTVAECMDIHPRRHEIADWHLYIKHTKWSPDGTVTNHTHTGTHLHPVWSHDGAQVLYASDASGIAQLCVIDV